MEFVQQMVWGGWLNDETLNKLSRELEMFAYGKMPAAFVWGTMAGRHLNMRVLHCAPVINIV